MTLWLQGPAWAEANEFQPGEWSARAMHEGLRFSLAFAQAYEPFFIVGDKRVSSDHSVEQTPHALWLYRELFGLYDCLGTEFGIVGDVLGDRYEVHSVLHLPDATLLDDAASKAKTQHSPLMLAPTWGLGQCEDIETLHRSAVEHCGTQAPIELRREATGRVLMRKRLPKT